MKKIISILIFTLLTSFAFGQTEKENHKTVSYSFEKNYNSDNLDAIFATFSTEMQNALPIYKTKEFLTDLKKEAGNITKRQFIKYEQGFASYKTNFEKSLFAVNIAVDSNSKISGFLVKPFVEIPIIERNKTKLSLPFKNEWTVTWGGT